MVKDDWAAALTQRAQNRLSAAEVSLPAASPAEAIPVPASPELHDVFDEDLMTAIRNSEETFRAAKIPWEAFSAPCPGAQPEISVDPSSVSSNQVRASFNSPIVGPIATASRVWPPNQQRPHQSDPPKVAFNDKALANSWKEWQGLPLRK